MTNYDRDGDRRQSEREKKLARDRDNYMRKRRRAERSQWQPEIKIDGSAADPEFVRRITQIIENLPFDDERYFPPAYRQLYAQLKLGGATAVFRFIAGREPSDVRCEIAYRQFGMHLGHLVIESLTPAEKEKYLPFNDVDVDADGNGARALIRSLSVAKINGKPILVRNKPCYYSPRKPTIDVNGSPKIVTFSTHAIERTCERACTNSKTFAGLGDAFAFFADCMYFEPCVIRGRAGDRRPQFAISFFQDCFLDRYRAEILCPPNEYFMKLIGPYPEHLKKHWYYRVGYCPIKVRGDFAIAHTLLYPGYSATPEFELLERSAIDPKTKEEMMKRANDGTYEKLIKTFDYEMAKWFHDNGTPQVCALPGDVFARADGTGPRPAPIDSPISDFFKVRHLA